MEQIEAFISPGFLAVVPVLYFFGTWLKSNTKFSNAKIPLTLGLTGIALSVLYTFATVPVHSGMQIANTLFTSITQGILCAGAAVYSHQVYKQGHQPESTPDAA